MHFLVILLQQLLLALLTALFRSTMDVRKIRQRTCLLSCVSFTSIQHACKKAR